MLPGLPISAVIGHGLLADSMQFAGWFRDLEGVGELLSAQTDAGLAKADVLESLFQSWSLRLESVSVPTSEMAALTRAVTGGPWTQEQKRKLASSIMGTAPAHVTKVARRSGQTCENFVNFLTTCDWGKLSAHKSKSQVLDVLASRAWSIGLVCPSERTLHKMAGIIGVITGCQELSQDEVSTLMNEVKLFIKGKEQQLKRTTHITHLTVYPTVAAELPQDIKDTAYSGEGPPDPVQDIPEIASVLGATKMRPRREAPSWLQSVPPEYKELLATMHAKLSGGKRATPPLTFNTTNYHADENIPARNLGVPISLLTQPRALAESSARGSSDFPVPTSLPSLRVQETPRFVEAGIEAAAQPASRAEAALGQPLLGVAQAGAKRESQTSHDEEDEATVHQMEMEMLLSMAQKQSSKQGTASAAIAATLTGGEDTKSKTKGNSNPKKAGAGEAGVTKRPSAKVGATEKDSRKKFTAAAAEAANGAIDMQDVYKKLREDLSGLSRRAATSRLYSFAMRRATAAGMSVDDAKRVAKVHYAQAARIWDNKLG